MFVFVFERPLLRLSVKAPVFTPLFQLPPRKKAAFAGFSRVGQDYLTHLAEAEAFASNPPVRLPSSTANATR